MRPRFSLLHRRGVQLIRGTSTSWKACVVADLLIRGGEVYDGSGRASDRCDVIAVNGRIEALSAGAHTSIEARRVIDAAGLAVSPGFIDIHTHSDISVFLDGRAQSKVHQGVTTEVVGNCGFSPFPLTDERLPDQLDLLAGIGDDPISPPWSDVAGYAHAVEAATIALNVAPLVGHGQLRIAAAGMVEKLDTNMLDAMLRLLEQQLEQGAFGLSTGLTYVPSMYAPPSELEALCATLARHGALYATHARGDGFRAVRDAAQLGRATSARIQYSHVALNEPQNWGSAEQLLRTFDDARHDGVDIACDVYPYDASASALTQYLPPWVQQGGVGAMRARLADTTVMQRAETDLAAGWGDGGRIPWFWDRVMLARTDGILDAPEGATVEEAAAGARMSPERFVLELCRRGGNRMQVVMFYRSEQDMRAFLRYEHTVVGSDGSALPYEQVGRRPHPRAYGAHARVLGRYVRELGDLDLATAVHKMTGAVADRLGITDRGLLTAGRAADVVVFDPATVRDRASFLDPCRPPDGVRYVVVNGEIVIDDGVQTRARPGRVLQSHRP